MKNWQHYWKSILAFAVLVATNAVADLTQSGAPWPASGGDWARWGVSIIGGTLVVYGKGNAPKKAEPAAEDMQADIPPAIGPTHDPKRRPVL